ncbi:ras-related protein Rab-10-like [Corticium candelabrum]|uniref:ras-related protein Rab-10-like n=1 Tax=Corticium candelabrum TaxID=121492 RepID=UPI002E37BD6B|nr:ras-related protein Rab-10-like [Corticium candelabrum]
MARKSFDFKFNLILVGDSDVGKTKILTRFGLDVGGLPDFSTGMPDFNTKTVLVQKKLIELKLWNTEGQEKFRSINADLYRRAMGFMLVYDITSRSSFDNIFMWLREIEEERAPTEIERILLGNRCEMCDRRKVSKEEGERFAREHSIPFLETSTENNLNIEQAFMTLTENILKKVMSVSPLSLPVSFLKQELSINKHTNTGEHITGFE